MSEQTAVSAEVDPFEEKGQSTNPTEPGIKELIIPESPAPKKVFTRTDIKRTVSVALHLPKIYPDYDPWVFEFRIKLSKQAQERREEYLSLSASEMTVKLSDQALDEVCDLLVSMPKGFGDLQETGKGPGHSFRSYVETADQEAKDQLYQIVEGADNLYWTSISPREFRG